MTVFLNQLKEDWVVDRLRNEWVTHNKDIYTSSPRKANIIWIIAPWLWKNIKLKHLNNKKVICSIYHIEEFKMDDDYLSDFYERDQYVDEYHVISKKTEEQLKKLTNKKITHIPFWINQNIFYEINTKDSIRKKFNLPDDSFLVGSFQRDSEGNNPNKAKYIKGPDQFIEIVRYLKTINKNLEVVLTGKRRDYIVSELKKYNIGYYIFEMTDFESLNEIYNCIDLYIVASRIEGGPQAIMECAITKTPIISTDVGIASEILSPKSIFNMSNFKNANPDTEYAYRNSLRFTIPEGFKEYRELLEH